MLQLAGLTPHQNAEAMSKIRGFQDYCGCGIAGTIFFAGVISLVTLQVSLQGWQSFGLTKIAVILFGSILLAGIAKGVALFANHVRMKSFRAKIKRQSAKNRSAIA